MKRSDADLDKVPGHSHQDGESPGNRQNHSPIHKKAKDAQVDDGACATDGGELHWPGQMPGFDFELSFELAKAIPLFSKRHTHPAKGFS